MKEFRNLFVLAGSGSNVLGPSYIIHSGPCIVPNSLSFHYALRSDEKLINVTKSETKSKLLPVKQAKY